MASIEVTPPLMCSEIVKATMQRAKPVGQILQICQVVLLVVNSLVVLGGGFYFAGNLNARLDALTTALVDIRNTNDAQDTRVLDFAARVGRIEGFMERGSTK